MRKRGILCAAIAIGWLAGAGAGRAADVLVYGPSLAPQNCGSDAVPGSAQGGAPEGDCLAGGDPVVNEATVAEDRGHDVTIVDQATWSSMTQEEFAAYDAIVIGDAGCDFSDGEDLDAVDANKEVWSPVVTGHVTLNSFDGFWHIFQSESTEEGIRALAGSGIDFAASGEGTGLYYSNGCRGFEDCATEGCLAGARITAPEGGASYVVLEFLSELGEFQILTESRNAIEIVAPEHPAMLGTTEENLSFWNSSTHATLEVFPQEFEVTAIGGGEEEGGGGGPPAPVVLVRGAAPLPDWVEVPTLTPGPLALLAIGLGASAFVALRRRRA